MAEGNGAKGGAGTLTKAREDAPHNPGTARLKEELEEYIEARLAVMLQGVGHGIGEGARRIGEGNVGGGLASTASHAKGALMDKAKGATGKAKDMAGKAKDAAVGKKKKKDPEGGTGRGHTMIEDIDVGVPVREAYNQWTQFQEFSRFAKGVIAVEQQDDTTTQWHVKVAKSKRHWRGNITEQVPDQRIVWTSEGEKATTKGVVTFHPLGENLTKVLLVIEYSPKGLFERTGGLFRAQGRRARLDLKLFRTFVMMRGEATGGWRGEIHEGEVTEPDDSAEDTEAEGTDETEDTEAEDTDTGADDEVPDEESEDEDRDEDTEARDEDEEEDEDQDEDEDEEGEYEEDEDEDTEARDEEADDEYADDEEEDEDEGEEPEGEARSSKP